MANYEKVLEACAVVDSMKDNVTDQQLINAMRNIRSETGAGIEPGKYLKRRIVGNKVTTVGTLTREQALEVIESCRVFAAGCINNPVRG